MNISELSLKRPVLATVMNLIIILFGIVGYTFLAVRDYPAIDPPIITVTTSYTGANPDLIDGSRRKRIAKGSGKDISEVNAFMKQFEQMREMMKSMNKMPMGRMMPGMKR